jgi:gamma-glutamylaminecyclotransferase
MAALTRHLFVYGTLMRGGRFAHHMTGARFMGPGRTRPEWNLYSLGLFPAIVPGGATAVVGEVYEVDREILVRLDEVEGHPEFFRRTPIVLAEGHEAEAYVLPSPPAGAVRIESGDWRRARGEAPPA